MKERFYCFVILTLLWGAATSGALAEGEKTSIHPEVEQALTAWLATANPSEEDDWPVYEAALKNEEALEPVFEFLQDDASEKARWLRAKLHWRYGLLDEARVLFAGLAEETGSPLAAYRVAQLFDATGREQDAVEAYGKVLEDEKASAWHAEVRLRLAIFKSTGGQTEGELDDLLTFAEDSTDTNFKNRAAVVLALAGKPEDSIDLYQINSEEAKTRFQQEIRVAEWAMAAKQADKAQEAAWNALQEATMRRDRRYALTILAEAYRVDRDLPSLVERFAGENDLDEDSRHAWIDLLRELGQAGEALALFEQAAEDDAEFTPAMRRELLEICRETGREEVLVDAYRQAIAEQPARLEWRAGLSRYYLESGHEEQGHRVWDGFLEAAKTGDLLNAAETALQLGLEDLAVAYAEHVIATTDGIIPGLQFLFQMHRSRGRDSEMVAVLERMEALAEPDADGRVQLAESWEQIGRQDKAADVLERLRLARGADNFSADLEMRLAWLYSETGDEEKAYEYWRHVWLRVESPGRRRYVEDRLMATASRLGKLADIAIELEEKLLEGRAEKRDSALLVRLYTKAGDPVSASEIIEEFLKQSGGSEIQVLEEKARIYVMCNDYYHYDKTLRELMRLDPEGKPEYLTQLAMSCLERGKNDEAREVLTEMRSLEKNPASSEFEAGVLKIAGMHEEAVRAYWRGIAEHPDRIDAYLLLGQSLQTVGRARQAQGIFQYLVENAGQDDLFTIAVDGLLNAQAGRPVMQWARRLILQRIAERDDKVYLYQLLGDVSEELRDQAMLMRALAETLPIAGERRTSQLRELIELSKVGVGGSSFSSRGTRSAKDREALMRYGRRLLGMGEAVPPQVHLDLGQAFLDGGDIRNAAKTFARAEDVSDYAGFQRKVAASFEQKRYVKSALRLYEGLLLGDHADVSLILKLGELKEQLGRDDDARKAYERALDQLIVLQPMISAKEDAPPEGQRYMWARNQDAYAKYFPRVMQGYFATATPGEHAAVFLDAQEEKLAEEIDQLGKIERPREEQSLARSPRVNRRVELIRRIALGFKQGERLNHLHAVLIHAFPEDPELLPALCQSLMRWGLADLAETTLSRFSRHPSAEAGRKLLDQQRQGFEKSGLFPALITGEPSATTLLLRRAAAGEKTGGLQEDLFNAARFLDDQATLHRLARQAVLATPDPQVWQLIHVLGRAWPHLDSSARHSLADLVEEKLAGIPPSGNRSMAYYVQQLNRLTERQFHLPVEHVRKSVQDALSQGGHYVNSIGIFFSVLEPEDYRELLKESFSKAKRSDRLPILFSLVKSYDGEMAGDLKQLFVELSREAVAEGRVDVLGAWNSARRYYNDGSETETEFAAELLDLSGAKLPPEKQAEIDAVRASILLQNGRTEEASSLAHKVQTLALQEKWEMDRNTLRTMQRNFMPAHGTTLLAAFDEAARSDKYNSLEVTKAKLAFIRQIADQSLLLEHVIKAAAQFPEEKSFQDEHRRMLESMGLIWDALQIQQAAVDADPRNPALRQKLAALWKRMEHPIKASEAEKIPPEKNDPQEKQTSPENNAAESDEQSAQSSPATPSPRVSEAPSATAGAATLRASGQPPAPKDEAKAAAEEPVEKLPEANIAAVKEALENGKPEEAGTLFRRLWRQFPTLDNANHYVSPNNLSPYQWPQSNPSTNTSGQTGSPLGGMKHFLTKPVPSPAQARSQSSNIRTIFEERGTEPVITTEVERAVRSLDPEHHTGSVFQRQIDALAEARVEALGLAEALDEALGRLERGDTTLPSDRWMTYALLDIGTESAEPAVQTKVRALRDRLFLQASAGDTVQLMQLARCLAKTGQPERAASLYRWCAGKTLFSPYDYGDGRLTTQRLVNEIRQYLEGEHRLHALESVFELSRPTQTTARAMAPYYMLVLNTWKEVLPAEKTLSRTRAICEEVLRDYPDIPILAKLAAVYLGAGGAVDQGIAALRKALTAPASSGGAPSGTTMVYNSNGTISYVSGGNRASQTHFGEGDLRFFFPDSLDSWKRPGPWLVQLSELMADLLESGGVSPREGARVLALAAVHQHDLGFLEAARSTLDQLRQIPLTSPEDHLWVWDAAEHLGAEDVWRELGLALWHKRQLQVNRFPSLLQAVARARGHQAALDLGEEMLSVTRHPEVLSICRGLAFESGQAEKAAFWESKQRELLTMTGQAERYGFLVTAGEDTTLFRYQELASEKEIRHVVGDIPHLLSFDDAEGRVRVVRQSDENEELVLPMMVLTSEWRQQHPEGDVYLVSLLEKAKTFLVKKGDAGWRHYDDAAAPPENWSRHSFDDSTWPEGSSPLGYGESVSTTLSFGGDPSDKTLTAYFRKTVAIEKIEDLARAYAGIECDDGSIIYINGREVHRVNMREEDEDKHTTVAAGKGEKGKTARFLIDTKYLHEGNNTIAVSVHQADASSSDLYMDFELRIVTKSDLNKSLK